MEKSIKPCSQVALGQLVVESLYLPIKTLNISSRTTPKIDQCLHNFD